MEEINQPPAPAPGPTPTIDPIAAAPSVVQGQVVGQVPQQSPGNKTCLVAAIIGCVVALVILPIIAFLIIFVVVAINPAARLKQVQENAAKTASQSAQINTTDQTDTWKTYSNKTYGFELKYPQEMSNDGESAQGNLATLEIKDGTNSSTLGSGMFIHIYQANGDGYETIKAAAATQAEIDKKYLISVVDRTIGENITAKSVNVRCENVTDILCDDVYTYVSLKDGQTLGIRAQWTEAYKDKNEKIYNQILTTFKFLQN